MTYGDLSLTDLVARCREWDCSTCAFFFVTSKLVTDPGFGSWVESECCCRIGKPRHWPDEITDGVLGLEVKEP